MYVFLNMLTSVLLCLLATAASCNGYGWKDGKQYKFDYKICYFSSMREDTDQNILWNGSFLKSDLLIIPVSGDKLSVTIQNARMHRFVDAQRLDVCDNLPGGAKFKNVSLISGEPFEINLKNGIATGLNVHESVADPELKLIKSVTSKLQLDLRGETCMGPDSCKPETINAAYMTVEDSNFGACETQYKVSPLPKNTPSSLHDGQLLEVVKTTDYKKCRQSSTELENEVGKLFADKFVSLAGGSRIVVSRNAKQYVIQSSVQTTAVEFMSQSPQISKPTTISVSNLTLTSTQPTTGLPRIVSNPREVSWNTNNSFENSPYAHFAKLRQK